MVIHTVISILLIIVGLGAMVVGFKALHVIKRRKQVGWKPATYSADVPEHIKHQIHRDRKDWERRVWYVTK